MSRNLSETTIDKLYNKADKMDYLENSGLEEPTQPTVLTNLTIVAPFESLLKKDLYDFDKKDILNCFKSVEEKYSINSLRLLFSNCKSYVEWAVVKGLNMTSMNPFVEMKFEINIASILDPKNFKNKLLTEKQVWEIEKSAKNYREYVCLLPVFYGIMGDNSCELADLKKDYIDYINNTINLGTKRTMHLSQEIIEIFKKASDQTIYIKRGEQGQIGGTTRKLIDSDYVIRPIGKKKEGEGKVKAQTIAKYCKYLLEDSGYPNISIYDIYKNGKLCFLRYIQQKEGRKLKIKDYQRVNRHFGENNDNYKILRELYKSTILDDELNVPNEKSFWDEVRLLNDEEDEEEEDEDDDNKNIFIYEYDFSDEDENNMNNSDGNNDESDKGKNTSREGGRTESQVNQHARSRAARNRCIEIHGAKCNICKFDFGKVYGEFGKGLIHVHHINQISKTVGVYIINAEKDLLPVCPNCHLIIHKDKNKACSIEEVEDMIKNNKEK